MREQFRLEPGSQGRSFTGINRKFDPGAIADTDSFYAQNIRIAGGRMGNRWGQSKLNGSSATQGCVMGIQNQDATQVVGAPGILWFDPCGLGTSPSGAQDGQSGAGCFAYSPDLNPQFQPCLGVPRGIRNGKPFVFGTAILNHGADTPNYLELQVTMPPSGILMRDINSPAYRETAIQQAVPPTSQVFQPVVRTELLSDNTVGEVAYMPLSSDGNAGTTGKVGRFDGLNYTIEAIAVAGGVVCSPDAVGIYRENLIVGSSQGLVGSPVFYRRDSATTYTSITSALPQFIPSTQSLMVEYKDSLYAAGLDNGGTGGKIMSYAGTSFATARTPANGGDTAESVFGVCVFNGFLYYLWKGSTGANWQRRIYVGKYDGSSWTDTEYSDLQALTGHTGVFLETVQCAGPWAYRGNVFAMAGFSGPSATVGTIAKSNGTTTTSFSNAQTIGTPGTTNFPFFPLYATVY